MTDSLLNHLLHILQGMKTSTFPLFLALAAACGGPPDLLEPSGAEATSPVNTNAPPAVQPDPPAGPGENPPPLEGFPCEVRAALQTHCAGCHAGAVYIPGFASRGDFIADLGGGATLGRRMVERLQSTQRPMPPPGSPTGPTADELATLSAWVESGMPAGACGDLTGR